jgi:hypothetical protein
VYDERALHSSHKPVPARKLQRHQRYKHDLHVSMCVWIGSLYDE